MVVGAGSCTGGPARGAPGSWAWAQVLPGAPVLAIPACLLPRETRCQALEALVCSTAEGDIFHGEKKERSGFFVVCFPLIFLCGFIFDMDLGRCNFC